MKNIKDIDGNLIKVDSGCTVQPFHAYISLVLSLLKEPFVSYDGGPIFTSLKLLNKEDSENVFYYYEKYKKLREEVDNF